MDFSVVVIMIRKVVFNDTLRTQFVEKVEPVVVQFQDRLSRSFSVDSRFLVDQQYVTDCMEDNKIVLMFF